MSGVSSSRDRAPPVARYGGADRVVTVWGVGEAVTAMVTRAGFQPASPVSAQVFLAIELPGQGDR